MSVELLDQLTLLEINGDDATQFLQGQLTNDINQAVNTWQFSGYCNPKGRLLALFKVWRYQDSIYALIDNTLVDSIVKRLRMYVMRSKVEIHISESKCFGLLNVESLRQSITQISQPTIDLLTNDKNAFFSDGQHHILSLGDRFLYVSTQTISNAKTDSHEWLTLDIQDGLPSVAQLSTELFIPQMLNLDILGGINFKKGCYTGQEIVARMHYLGKVKQRMFVTKLSQEDENIQVGDKVYSDESLGKNAGNIVAIQGSDALAVLRTEETSEQQQYYLNQTTSLEVRPQQPYSLDQ